MERFHEFCVTAQNEATKAAPRLARGCSQAAVLEYGLIVLGLVVAVVTTVGTDGADLIGKLGWIRIQYAS